MQAGNAFYNSVRDIPDKLPILSMASIMLMPGGFVPLTLSELRFIEMVDDAMKTNKLIGMVLAKAGTPKAKVENHNPHYFDPEDLYKYRAANDNIATWRIGCIGRITNYSEVGDGQIMISLQGICRFQLETQIFSQKPYREFHITPFATDLAEHDENTPIDRKLFMRVFQKYLAQNHMQADWDIISEVSNEALVNALSVIVPFAPAEKQVLLEAPDLKTRSETMMAIAERSMLLDQQYGNKMVQ